DGDGTDDATEGNVISGNVQDGVLVRGGSSDRNHVSGNLIGTNAAGNAAVPNGANGVHILNGPNASIIGTNSDGRSDVAERNVISGNTGDGVLIFGGSVPNTKVAGNFIGTSVDGVTPIPNQQHGVSIENDADLSIIGSNSDGVNDAVEGNVISGNAGNGVTVISNNTLQNRINGNSIF